MTRRIQGSLIRSRYNELNVRPVITERFTINETGECFKCHRRMYFVVIRTQCNIKNNIEYGFCLLVLLEKMLDKK